METAINKGLHAELTPSCRCEVTQRGPNWLFVHVDTIGMGCGLAERLWRVAQTQLTNRIVLDFDKSEPTDPRLGVELGWLCHRLSEAGGALRLCGLPPEIAEEVLAHADCPRLHNHLTARDAVLGGPCCDGEDDSFPPGLPR
ncbi:hypothetical protein MalM25_31430 [Planctomycetes bacterium MalM25]|nr:hypothetical protein MalM25_31430 [Planctomycetes bacterium MalM25]